MIAYDAAFAGLHHDIHHAIADGNLVAVNSTMNGRHTRPMGRIHRRRRGGRGLPADEQDLRGNPVPLVPDRRWHDRRALG